MQISVALRETVEKLTPVLGTFSLPYSERILEHLLGCSRNELYLSSKRSLGEEQFKKLSTIVERCKREEPLDYIIGRSYFFNREFMVSPAVLIPRPDTEVLVEQILQHETEKSALFAEIGVGSGIISCVLTEERPEWNAVGIDISMEPLLMTRTNRKSNRIKLISSDCLSAISKNVQFDFIVSNPPYIQSEDIATLGASVKNYEPHEALDGGSDGLVFYRRFAKELPDNLKPGGVLYCEIGYDQREAIQALFQKPFWEDFHCFYDLAGHPRVIRVCSRK